MKCSREAIEQIVLDEPSNMESVLLMARNKNYETR